MSKQTRYLLTVDSDTGVAVKLERLGEAGDLTEVPLGHLSGVAPPPPAPPPGAPAPHSLVINIYMGGPAPVAPPVVAVREPPPPGPWLTGPGGVGIPTGPGGIGAPVDTPLPSSAPTGPGGPAGGSRFEQDGGSDGSGSPP